MPDPTVLQGNVAVLGDFTATTMTIPSASIGNAQVKTGDPVSSDKLQHRITARLSQALGADVVAVTEVVHIGHAAGTLLAVKVVSNTPPTGGDKKVTVDVKRGSAGGAYSSVLTAPLDIDSAIAARAVTPATINSAAYSAGDSYQIAISVSGSTGTQAQDICVELIFSENPS